MQKRRNIALLISLIVLSTATAVVYLIQHREARAAVDPGLFKVADTEKSDHVVLATGNRKIDLHYSGNSWKVNERFEADPQLIKVLMATLMQVTPQRPVAVQQRDSVESWLAQDGTSVKVFAGNLLQKEFTAGGNPAKTTAYFSDTEHHAYIITIPGYRVYASGIFDLSENDWREKRIFNFNWRNFKRLTLKITKEPAADFEIAREGDFLGVVGLDKPDSSRINTFLSDVLALSADQILTAGASRPYDSLAKTTPVLSLSVLDITGKTYRLELFPPLSGDNKVVGKALDGELVLFDRRKTFSVFKKRGYFSVK